MYTSTRLNFKELFISILISLGTGILSSILTFKNMDLYSTIVLPPLAPSRILFPIVWSILYILMGVSAYGVYQSNSKDKSFALIIYALQLAINFIWTLLFFNARFFWISFLCLITLWILILAMIKTFKSINELSGYLQIPYILWVSFAGYLNFMIAILN